MGGDKHTVVRLVGQSGKVLRGSDMKMCEWGEVFAVIWVVAEPVPRRPSASV